MIRVLIPTLAGCSLLASLFAAITTADFLRDAKSTTATIVRSESQIGDDGTRLHRPTFNFSADGREYSVTPASYAAPAPGNVGDTVRVLYDPHQPSNARIDAFVYTWMLPTITLVLGSVLGTLHLALVWFNRNFRYIGSDGEQSNE